MSAHSRTGEFPHLPLHVILLIYVVITLYPLLWVFTIGFSGQQGLMIVDIPANATFMDRIGSLRPLGSNPNSTLCRCERKFCTYITTIRKRVKWVTRRASGSRKA